MKPKLNNPHGYKVCYKEKGGKRYVRHFLTYTYTQAKQAKEFYIKIPQNARTDGHPLNKPEWVIIPIKRSEVRAGIWHEVPFWKEGHLSFYKTKRRNNK